MSDIQVPGWSGLSAEAQADIEQILRSSNAIRAQDRVADAGRGVAVQSLSNPFCEIACDVAATAAVAACGALSGPAVGVCIAAAEAARRYCKSRC